MRERNSLASRMEAVTKLQSDVADALELLELAEADGDSAMASEATANLRALAEEAKRRKSKACCPVRRMRTTATSN